MRGIVLVKAQATTQKGAAMRLLMIALFLLSANAGMAFGEGRYQLAGSGGPDGYSGWLVLDTKTGAVKYCHPSRANDKPYADNSPKCSPWSKN